MNESTLEHILDKLLILGLVEQKGNDIQTTLRWRTKLQATAEKINQINARDGQRLEGNPLVLAAAQTLANENLDIPNDEFDEHVQVLVLLELSRMSPAKRTSMGFPDVLFPGEKKAQSGQGVEFM